MGGKCQCLLGFCADSENHCQYSNTWTCNIDTGGTCSIMDCFPTRGPTVCHLNMCLCKEGYCTNSLGKCVPSNTTTAAHAKANPAQLLANPRPSGFTLWISAAAVAVVFVVIGLHCGTFSRKGQYESRRAPLLADAS